MSKTEKNYVKKDLKINTDNFGFSLSQHKNKSTNFLSIKQKLIGTPPLNNKNNINNDINNNINNQFRNNNINIINININSNYNNNKKKNINTNANTNITYFNNNISKNPFINYIKKNSNFKSNSKYNIQKKPKIETKEENINNFIKSDKKVKKEENINSSTSRPETEINKRKSSFKIDNSKKGQILPIETPKQMIISYLDIKNILNKKNLKLEFKKKEKMLRTAKTENKSEEFNHLNKDKKIIVTKKYNKKLVSDKHQSEENLLKLKNNYIYINKIIKQSSFLNKNLFNNVDNSRKNNDISISNKIDSCRYLKTSDNIPIENNKIIRHYYTKNEIINIDKNNIYKDDINKREKNKILNNNMIPSLSLINSLSKSQNFANIHFFQKFIYNKKSDSNNNIKNIINISNIKKFKRNSNNEIKKAFNLSRKNNTIKDKNDSLNINESINTIKINFTYQKNIKEEKSNIHIKELFDNEKKINNFKNPEELHFLYIKIFQVGNEISNNFEN